MKSGQLANLYGYDGKEIKTDAADKGTRRLSENSDRSESKSA